MSKSQMTAICSIIYNALYGTFSVKRSIVDNLRAYKEQLRKIVDKKIATSTRKDLMVRRAHEISVLLRTVLKDIPMNNNVSERADFDSETETTKFENLFDFTDVKKLPDSNHVPDGVSKQLDAQSLSDLNAGHDFVMHRVQDGVPGLLEKKSKQRRKTLKWKPY